MAQKPGVAGIGVTPLVNGQEVNGGNPMPTTGGGGFTPSDIKFFQVNPLVLGNNLCITAVPLKKFRILSFSWDSGNTVTKQQWEGAAAAVSIYGPFNDVLGGDEAAPNGLFENGIGEKLDFVLFALPGAGASVSGSYVELT